MVTLATVRTSIIRTSIIQNLDHPALQIACFNDIHCDFGVRHLEYSVRHLEYLLQSA